LFYNKKLSHNDIKNKNVIINFKNKKSKFIKFNKFIFKNTFFRFKKNTNPNFPISNRNLILLITYTFNNLVYPKIFSNNINSFFSFFLSNFFKFFIFFNCNIKFFYYIKIAFFSSTLFFSHNSPLSLEKKNLFFQKIFFSKYNSNSNSNSYIFNYFRLNNLFPQLLQKKINLIKYNRLSIFKENSTLSSYNTQFLKKRFIFFKFINISPKFKFLTYNKLFFSIFKKTNNINGTFFKIRKNDWINFSLARLTKSSFKLNNNDFFFNKLLNSFFLKTNSLNFFFSYYFLSDKIIKNNFFFLKKRNFNTFYRSFLKEISVFNNTNISNFFFKKPTFLKSDILFSSKSLITPTLPSFNSYNFRFNLYLFNSLEYLFFFLFKPTFFKFFLLFYKDTKKNFDFPILNLFDFKNADSFFYSNNCNINNNLMPSNSFFFILKKKMLQIFNYDKFPVITSIWFYETLIKFLEFCSGKKVNLTLYTFLNNNLDFYEKSQCALWARKVKYFRKVLGPRLFLNESLQIIYLALKLKDPFFLSNWIVSTIQKIDFWKYKTFLRYIKYVLRYFFWVIFRDLGIKGIKFQLKGKISVAGNARTRTARHTIGATGNATFDNKILYKLNLVRTFTGVLGLKLWISF
jgi:hypothetical protein